MIFALEQLIALCCFFYLGVVTKGDFICFEFEERIAEEQRLVNPRSQEALVEA